ncbi:MAG: helix-turn-helix transcriptional regulator [Burkholderiales bacterium]|nr:helix-turn-helix transcriptional regulator [Burkholderiales bacterium]
MVKKQNSPLGSLIEKRLDDLGKTQNWLAVETGLSPAAVSKWMKGGDLKRKQVSRLRELLKVSGDTLLDACEGKWVKVVSSTSAAPYLSASPPAAAFVADRDDVFHHAAPLRSEDLKIAELCRVVQELGPDEVDYLLKKARRILDEESSLRHDIKKSGHSA